MLLIILVIALQLSPHFGLNQDLEEPFLLKFGPSKGDSFNSKLWDACSEEQFFGRGLKFGRNYYKSCYVCMNGYLAFGKQYRGYDPSSFNIGNTPVGTSFNNNGNCNNGGNLPTPDATTSLTNQIVVTTTTPDNFVNTTSVSSQGNTTIGDLSKNTTPSPSAAETTTQWLTKTTNWSSVSTKTTESVDQTTQLPTEYVTSSGWLDSTTQIRDSTQDSTTKGTPLNGWPETTTPPDIQTLGSGESVGKTTQIPTEYVTSSGWLDSTTQIRDSTQDSTTKGTPFNGWPENTTPPDIQTFGSGESVDKTTQLPTEYVTSSGWSDSTTQIRDSTTKGTLLNGWPETTTPPDIQTLGSGGLEEISTTLTYGTGASGDKLYSTTPKATTNTPFNGWPEITTPTNFETSGSSGWLQSSTVSTADGRTSSQKSFGTIPVFSGNNATVFNGWPEITTPTAYDISSSSGWIQSSTVSTAESRASHKYYSTIPVSSDNTVTASSGWQDNTTPMSIETIGSSGWWESSAASTHAPDSTSKLETTNTPFNGWPELTTLAAFETSESSDGTKTYTITTADRSSGSQRSPSTFPVDVKSTTADLSFGRDDTTPKPFEISDSSSFSQSTTATAANYRANSENPYSTIPDDNQNTAEPFNRFSQSSTVTAANNRANSHSPYSTIPDDNQNTAAPFNVWPGITTEAAFETSDSSDGKKTYTVTTADKSFNSQRSHSTFPVDVKSTATDLSFRRDNTTPKVFEKSDSSPFSQSSTVTAANNRANSQSPYSTIPDDNQNTAAPFNVWSGVTTQGAFETSDSSDGTKTYTVTTADRSSNSQRSHSTFSVDVKSTATDLNFGRDNTTPIPFEKSDSSPFSQSSTVTAANNRANSQNPYITIPDDNQNTAAPLNGWPGITTPTAIENFDSSAGTKTYTVTTADRSSDNQRSHSTFPVDIKSTATDLSVGRDNTTPNSFDKSDSSPFSQSSTVTAANNRANSQNPYITIPDDNQNTAAPFNGWPGIITQAAFETSESSDGTKIYTVTTADRSYNSQRSRSTFPVDVMSTATDLSFGRDNTTPKPFEKNNSSSFSQSSTVTAANNRANSQNPHITIPDDNQNTAAPFNGWPGTTTPASFEKFDSSSGTKTYTLATTDGISNSQRSHSTFPIDVKSTATDLSFGRDNTTPKPFEISDSSSFSQSTTATAANYRAYSENPYSTIPDDNQNTAAPFNGWPGITTPAAFETSDSIAGTKTYTVSTADRSSNSQRSHSTFPVDVESTATDLSFGRDNTTPKPFEKNNSSSFSPSSTVTASNNRANSRNPYSTIPDNNQNTAAPFNGWPGFTTPAAFNNFDTSGVQESSTISKFENRPGQQSFDKTTPESYRNTVYNSRLDTTVLPENVNHDFTDGVQRVTTSIVEDRASGGNFYSTTQTAPDNTALDDRREITTAAAYNKIGSSEAWTSGTTLAYEQRTHSESSRSPKFTATRSTEFDGWPENTTPPSSGNVDPGFWLEGGTTLAYNNRDGSGNFQRTTQHALQNPNFDWFDNTTPQVLDNIGTMAPFEPINTVSDGSLEVPSTTKVASVGLTDWWDSSTTSSKDNFASSDTFGSTTPVAIGTTAFSGWADITTTEAYESSFGSSFGEISASNSFENVEFSSSLETSSSFPIENSYFTSHFESSNPYSFVNNEFSGWWESGSSYPIENSYFTSYLESSNPYSFVNNEFSGWWESGSSYPIENSYFTSHLESSNPYSFVYNEFSGWWESGSSYPIENSYFTSHLESSNPYSFVNNEFSGWWESGSSYPIENSYFTSHLESSNPYSFVNNEFSGWWESGSSYPIENSYFTSRLESSNPYSFVNNEFSGWWESGSSYPIENSYFTIHLESSNPYSFVNNEFSGWWESGSSYPIENNYFTSHLESSNPYSFVNNEFSGWWGTSSLYLIEDTDFGSQVENSFSLPIDHTAFDGWVESPSSLVTENSSTDSLKPSTPTPAENTDSDGWWESNTFPTTRQIANQSTSPGGNFQNSTSAPPNVGGTTAIGYNWPFGDRGQFRNKVVICVMDIFHPPPPPPLDYRVHFFAHPTTAAIFLDSYSLYNGTFSVMVSA